MAVNVSRTISTNVGTSVYAQAYAQQIVDHFAQQERVAEDEDRAGRLVAEVDAARQRASDAGCRRRPVGALRSQLAGAVAPGFRAAGADCRQQ